MSRRKKKTKEDGAPSHPLGRPMRPVSRKTTFPKLRAMSCFQEVHERLCKGWPLKKVAEYIQHDCEEYTDASHHTVVKQLQNYRASIPPAERAKYTMSKSHMDAIDEVEEDIDEVKELIKLYRRQEKRLSIDEKVEQNIGKLMPTMTQEVRATAELLRTIATIKMDLGLNERHLGTVDITGNAIDAAAARYEGTDVGKVLEDPKKRRRLLSIAEHALALSGRHEEVTEVEEEPEGQLVVKDD